MTAPRENGHRQPGGTLNRSPLTGLRRTRFGLAVAAVFALVLGGLFVAAPAYAADAALVISKVVDGQPSVTVDPDDEFTYTISVGCNDNDCVDATMSDPLPAAWAGFPILAKQVVPASQPATLTLDGCDTVVTADCTLEAAFQQTLPGGGTGIVAGVTYQVSLTLKVPADLPASWPSNGVAVKNTASADATTADPVSASADVTVAIPVRIDTAVGKTWAPSTQQYQPGVASTITLTNQNTSNLPAETLTAQDPSSAVDGQAGDRHRQPVPPRRLHRIRPGRAPRGRRPGAGRRLRARPRDERLPLGHRLPGAARRHRAPRRRLGP
ncbi:isopeptide-forming domain-containing fimbrial protein [Cnuibacter sp. UC19_7]|uniref:isopeptide-forming domain-containing fimbrial protein n=1 Tax=Cnuibacter sp. UC19_7 TaxID=3350166 RepID=UPI00366AEF27